MINFNLHAKFLMLVLVLKQKKKFLGFLNKTCTLNSLSQSPAITKLYPCANIKSTSSLSQALNYGHSIGVPKEQNYFLGEFEKETPRKDMLPVLKQRKKIIFRDLKNRLTTLQVNLVKCEPSYDLFDRHSIRVHTEQTISK
jgi:hypothetical protein